MKKYTKLRQLCILALIIMMSLSQNILAAESGYTRIELVSGTEIAPESEQYKEETVIYDPPIQAESGIIEYNFRIEATDYDYDGACEIYILPAGFSYSSYDSSGYIGDFLFANAPIHFQWVGNGNGDPNEIFTAYHGIEYGQRERVAEGIEVGKVYDISVQIRPASKTYSVIVKLNGAEYASFPGLYFVDETVQTDFSGGIGSVVVMNGWETGMNAYVDVPANIVAAEPEPEPAPELIENAGGGDPAELPAPVPAAEAPATLAPAPRTADPISLIILGSVIPAAIIIKLKKENSI